MYTHIYTDIHLHSKKKWGWPLPSQDRWECPPFSVAYLALDLYLHTALYKYMYIYTYLY